MAQDGGQVASPKWKDDGQKRHGFGLQTNVSIVQHQHGSLAEAWLRAAPRYFCRVLRLLLLEHVLVDGNMRKLLLQLLAIAGSSVASLSIIALPAISDSGREAGTRIARLDHGMTRQDKLRWQLPNCILRGLI
jgi:hypothetical protein